MFFLNPRQDVDYHHNPRCVASLDTLDQGDLEVLTRYPSVCSETLELGVNMYKEMDGGQSVLVPMNNPVVLELVISDQHIARQFQEQPIVDSIYHKLSVDTYKAGIELVRKRMLNSPEVNLSSLAICAAAVLPTGQLQQMAGAGANDVIFCVTLELQITYKSGRMAQTAPTVVVTTTTR